MEAIQEVLFENKQDIPDGVYLKLMNLLKPEATQFYEIEYSIIKPDVIWDKEDTDYIVSVSPSHMKHRGCMSKTIIRLDKIRSETTKQSIISLTPFISYGWDIGMETWDMKTVRQSVNIRANEEADDSEEDDDECACDGHCEHTRKIHINNRFMLKTCIWVAKITRV